MKELANSGFVFLRRQPLVTAVVCLAALSMFTVWLSAMYFEARELQSEDYFLEGSLLESDGNMEAAADYYRDALTLDRENVVYRQALVRTLVQLRYIEEAENHLVELLEMVPTGGQANLMMARIAWERGDLLGAENYYQRAIYGLWTDSPIERRTDARFEFIDRLMGSGRRNRALLELLQLAQELPAGHPNNKRVASTLLALEAPREAANLLEMLTASNPNDAESWIGLGRAQMALQGYTEARDAFQHALDLSPDSAEVQTMLQTARSVLSLDPNRRGLSDRERIRRSRSLGERALALIHTCTAKNSVVLNPNEIAQVELAEEYLARAVPRNLPDDAAETSIAAAHSLWPVLNRVCQVADIEPGMRVVMERLGE